MTENTKYYNAVREKYPDTVTKEQFCKITHISKATARFERGGARSFPPEHCASACISPRPFERGASVANHRVLSRHYPSLVQREKASGFQYFQQVSDSQNQSCRVPCLASRFRYCKEKSAAYRPHQRISCVGERRRIITVKERVISPPKVGI